MSVRHWTINVCTDGHANGALWENGCEECFCVTEPVEVMPVAVVEDIQRRMEEIIGNELPGMIWTEVDAFFASLRSQLELAKPEGGTPNA